MSTNWKKEIHAAQAGFTKGRGIEDYISHETNKREMKRTPISQTTRHLTVKHQKLGKTVTEIRFLSHLVQLIQSVHQEQTCCL